MTDPEHTGYWGATGSGKSALMKQRIAGLKRLIVFDPLDEYGRPSRHGGGKIVPISTNTKAKLQNAIKRQTRDFRVAFVPMAADEETALNWLSEFCIMLQRSYAKPPRLTLVVEELNLSYPLQADKRVPFFSEIMSRGRHSNIEVLGASQGMSEVSTRFRRNTAANFICRQEGTADLTAVHNSTGVPKAMVQALPNLSYVESRGGVYTPGKLSFKKSKK